MLAQLLIGQFQEQKSSFRLNLNSTDPFFLQHRCPSCSGKNKIPKVVNELFDFQWQKNSSFIICHSSFTYPLFHHTFAAIIQRHVTHGC